MLALIAGTGDLPPALVTRLPERPLVCALDGSRPSIDWDVSFRIEHLGNFIAKLLEHGVTQICMAGAIRRPNIDPTAISPATAPLVPTLMAAIADGDDGALRSVIGIFEERGLEVVAAHDIAPDLLPLPGIHTIGHPNEAVILEAVVGVQTLIEMGRADVGQACVIVNGKALAQEDSDGTDAMLLNLRPANAPLEPLTNTEATWTDVRGGILFKGPKPDQDRRADLPVIGWQTAVYAAAVGLAGIVIEADGVMVLDLPAVCAVLNEEGMFLWVRPKGDA